MTLETESGSAAAHTVTGGVVSADGTRIAFDRFGSGLTAVVLVGGAFSERAGSRPLAEALAPYATAYAYDRRGRGDSGDTAPYAVEREIEDLAAIVAEAGGREVCVFGHSSGAGLVLRAAAAGVKMGRLALYEPPYIVDDTRRAVPSNFALHLAELVADDRRADVVALWMAHTVQMPEEAIAQMRQSPMWSALEALAHTTVYDLAIMSDTMSGTSLPQEWSTSVKVPTLVMVGGESPAWIQNSTEELTRLLPDARRHSLPGADHGVKPEQVVPVLREFFAASV
ncbi:MAG TPA: alpha/beta hydrolase [Actinocrinis sp.]|nr:alpha/beta hydrolase [Actinocrinis sp.]